MSQGKTLLAVIEFLAHTNLKAHYERLGYAVTQEFTVRKAIAHLRKARPDVLLPVRFPLAKRLETGSRGPSTAWRTLTASGRGRITGV